MKGMNEKYIEEHLSNLDKGVKDAETALGILGCADEKTGMRVVFGTKGESTYYGHAVDIDQGEMMLLLRMLQDLKRFRENNYNTINDNKSILLDAAIEVDSKMRST